MLNTLFSPEKRESSVSFQRDALHIQTHLFNKEFELLAATQTTESLLVKRNTNYLIQLGLLFKQLI